VCDRYVIVSARGTRAHLDRAIYCPAVPAIEGIEYRPMIVADVGSVPIAHQGNPEQVRARIADLGSSALLAFHDDQHVGQLQFRRYEPATKSPNGVWDPLYWMDFDEAPALPSDALCVFCCHIGQVDDTDARDERYQGRGIAATLLDHFLDWARAEGFSAVVAKATPPSRPVMGLLGGLPASVYEARGFETMARWVDADLARVVRQRQLVTESEIDAASTVSCCVVHLVV
jgi:GNAT superfamily N-acetyltransferase